MKPFCEEPSFSKLDQPDRKVTHQINCHRSHDSEAQSRVSANAPVESWLAWPVDEQCVLCIYVYLQYNIYLDTYIYIYMFVYVRVYIYIYLYVMGIPWDASPPSTPGNSGKRNPWFGAIWGFPLRKFR